MSKKLITLLTTIFTLFLISSASAHSGRTNSEGCHNKYSDGTYHCHNKKY